MTKVVYLHGFGSSNQTPKVQFLLEKFNTTCTIVAPNIPPKAVEAHHMLEQMMFDLKQDAEEVVLVGTSLGGFWAHLLGYQFGCRALLMNPAIKPSQTLRTFVGTDPFEGYTAAGFTYEDAAEYKDLEGELDFTEYANTERVVLVEKGDELLDTEATYTAYHTNSKVVMIEGGNHRFQSMDLFEHHLRELL